MASKPTPPATDPISGPSSASATGDPVVATSGSTTATTAAAVGTATANTSSSSSSTADGVIVPAEARQKYPDLVELILKSESMNTEERNYWLQVLPVMTKEQIEELRDILETEKKKLAAIDKKYSTMQVATTTADPAEVEKKRREARARRLHEEKAQQKTEEQIEKDLLGQLSALA